MKLGLTKLLVPTDSEIGANHAGMNTFFGAVLGFVLAGTERLDSIEFAYVLFMVAGTVISILYVSASRQKAVYSVLAIALILMLPRVVDPVLEPGEFLGASAPDTLEHFLIERYYLHVDRDGELMRGQVHHSAYLVQKATLLGLNDELIAAAGLPQPVGPPPLVHYVRGVDVEIFGLTPHFSI